MPHASMKIMPGVDLTKTPALNEAAISQSQLIRFVPDRTLGALVQKLGGWTKYYQNKIGSSVKNLWAWEDTNNNSYLAVGATGKLPVSVTNASGDGAKVTLTYNGLNQFTVGAKVTVSGINPTGYNGEYTITGVTSNTISYANTTVAAYVSSGTIKGGGGALQVITYGGATDVTPQTTTRNVTVDFSTTIGSNQVVVTDTGSNIDNYDVVNILTHVSVGGIILYGQYQCYQIGANTYWIYPYNALNEPYIATSTVANGGTVAKYTATTGSAYVDVTLDDHGFFVGNTYPILVAVSIGGITLYGNYTIVAVKSANVFTISTATLAGTLAVTGASGTGVTATLTHSSSYTITNGSSITVADINPAGYNGNYIVTASSAGSVSYANATVAAYVSGGTISGEYSTPENGGKVRFEYLLSTGPLPAGSGYGVGPYGIGGYGTGTAPTSVSGTPINADDWTLDNWGDTLIANPLNGPVYKWQPNTGTPQALAIANAPSVNEGIFIAMPQRQIIAWGSTYTGIQDPLQIRWSDVNDYNTWTATITNQAGGYRIPNASRIVQCIQGPQQGFIWTDISMWSMQYVGPPYVYQFNQLGTGCGLIGRRAAASISNVIYWMGQNQFFKYAGNGVEPLPCPIWDAAFQDLDRNYLENIRVAPNSYFNEIAWYYPVVGSNGVPTRYVKYNMILDQWDYGTLTRTAWLNQSVIGAPIGANEDQYIYQHETSTDADGQPMHSSFQTGYFAMSEADVKMFVDQVWPDMKWGYYDGTQGANVKITFYVTDYPGDSPPPSSVPATQYGPFILTQTTQFVTPRFRGRLVSIKIESEDIGSFWRLGNIRYRFQEDGKY